MLITEIKIYMQYESETKLKAYAAFTIDSCFVVDSIKVLQNGYSLFSAMPSRKLKDNKFVDIAHPINATTRNAIDQLLFCAYNYCVDNELQVQIFKLKDSFDKTLVDEALAPFESIFEPIEMKMAEE